MARKVLPLILLFALATPLMFALAAPSLLEVASGKADTTSYCGAEAEANIDKAIRYMRMRLDTLKNDYEFYTNPAISYISPQRRSDVRRRMEEKINDLKVNCATGVKCRNTKGNSLGIINDRIHICFEKAKEQGYSFCDLVQLIAYEYGYLIDMPKGNASVKDVAEMFGLFAGDLCRQDGVDRPLAAFSTPLNPRPKAPTSGIVLFPHANFEGRGRIFTGEFRDLRDIGRNDRFQRDREGIILAPAVK